MNNSSQLAIHPKGWKFKTVNRTKNRMRFQIKLDQENAESFRNFANQVKPPQISMDDFVAGIFFKGVRALEEELTAKAIQHMAENREDYEASGVLFDEEGQPSGFADEDPSASGSIEVVE